MCAVLCACNFHTTVFTILFEVNKNVRVIRYVTRPFNRSSMPRAAAINKGAAAAEYTRGKQDIPSRELDSYYIHYKWIL